MSRSTLLKIVGNLVDKPGERKFRCLRKGGAAFHEALGKLPGGYDALRAVGFRDATEPNGDEVLHSCCLSPFSPDAIVQITMESLSTVCRCSACVLHASCRFSLRSTCAGTCRA